MLNDKPLKQAVIHRQHKFADPISLKNKKNKKIIK